MSSLCEVRRHLCIVLHLYQLPSCPVVLPARSRLLSLSPCAALGQHTKRGQGCTLADTLPKHYQTMKLDSTALWAKTLQAYALLTEFPFQDYFHSSSSSHKTERGQQGPLPMPKFKCSPSSRAQPSNPSCSGRGRDEKRQWPHPNKAGG